MKVSVLLRNNFNEFHRFWSFWIYLNHKNLNIFRRVLFKECNHKKKTQQNPLARTERSVLLCYWGKFIHVKEVTIIMQNIIFRKKIFEKFKSFQPLATTRWIQECHWNIFRITWAIILPAFYFRRVLSSRALCHQRNLIGCVRGWSILNSAWLI